MTGKLQTSAEVEREIQRLIDSPSTSYWLKGALSALIQRDCLDAASDAETLAHLLGTRANLILEGK